MPRGDQPTTVALALLDGWVYEDQLPKSMTKAEYDAWYPESLVLDGVRMGPAFKISTARALLGQVWEHGLKDSWGRINTAMRKALSLAIGSGLQFVASDFKCIYAAPRVDGFNGGYWVGSENEWIYASAIENQNASCVAAWEEWTNRKPFFANDVAGRSWAPNFLHTNSVMRKRERLAVGFSFPLDGRRWFVTAFDDEAGILRAALYAQDHATGKPKKLRKFTHDEISDLFPAKKRCKGKITENEKSTDWNDKRICDACQATFADNSDQPAVGKRCTRMVEPEAQKAAA